MQPIKHDPIVDHLANFITGALSSGASLTLFFPLEHIKTHLQLPGMEELKKHNLFLQVPMTASYLYKKNGFSSFYTGYKPLLCYNMASWGTSFALFSHFKKKFRNIKNGDVLASFLTGIINVLLTTPLSVIANFMIAE